MNFIHLATDNKCNNNFSVPCSVNYMATSKNSHHFQPFSISCKKTYKGTKMSIFRRATTKNIIMPLHQIFLLQKILGVTHFVKIKYYTSFRVLSFIVVGDFSDFLGLYQTFWLDPNLNWTPKFYTLKSFAIFSITQEERNTILYGISEIAWLF